MKKFIIGIDVSKESLDYCLVETSTGSVCCEFQSKNTINSIQETLKKKQKEHSIDASELLLCAEYTGQYTYPLCCVCEDMKMGLWLENPAQIKYRSGVQRGKNDKLDARKIAFYAIRFIDDARLFSISERSIEALKQLISERDLYVVDRGKYQGQLRDQEHFMNKSDYLSKSKRLKRLIEELDCVIKEIEEQIKSIIDKDPELRNLHKLLCSIDGVGDKTETKMIVVTNAFKDFNNPRKFCCHAGVAPFSYESGSIFDQDGRSLTRQIKA